MAQGMSAVIHCHSRLVVSWNEVARGWTACVARTASSHSLCC